MKRKNPSRTFSTVKMPATRTNLASDPQQIEAILDANSQEIDCAPSLMLVDPDELGDLGVGSEISSVIENIINGNGNLSPLPLAPADAEEDPEIEIIERPAKVPKHDPQGRGRTLDPIWNHFHSNDKLLKTKAQCNLCGVAVSRKVERLRVHIEKNCIRKSGNSVSGPRSAPEQPIKLPPLFSASHASPSFGKQKNVSGFVDQMSKRDQADMNIVIGKYVYASNLPFSHVECPAFKELMNKVRPACIIPSRKYIGNSILNKVYEEVSRKQENELHGKTVTIMQDGWKNRTSEPVISHSVTTGRKAFFHGAINTEHNKKTAKYCAELLENAIEEVTQKGAEVFAVVTDNCKSMEKMRDIITKKYPNIFTYGCHPHLLNLVGKKFTPDEMILKVQAVHTFFRNHEAAWAFLKKKCGRPILASDTRWNAWLECLEYFIENHSKLLEVARKPEANVSDFVQEILLDNSFYNDVGTTIKYLKPIQEALDSLQKETASLADGVNAWLRLKNHLGIRELELQEYFDKQFTKALQPVAIAAHMLHPKYRGCHLSPELIQQGNKFLAAQKPFYVILASQLKLMDDRYFDALLFSDELLRTCSPDQWWKSLESLEKIDPSMLNFISKLMNLPAGSADIERHFSVLGNIMNVRRAKLGVEKASKLCVIYKHLAGKCAPCDDGAGWDESDTE